MRDAADLMVATLKRIEQPGSTDSEARAFFRAFGDMASACTDDGHPVPK